MPPKRKTNTKKSKRLIKNKNVLNVHIHKRTRAPRNSVPKVSAQEATRRYVVNDSFQPRLPAYQPFNINVPYTPPLQSAITAAATTAPLQNPVNVYVGTPLTHNTPTHNTLHNTGTAQSTVQSTPQTTPSTPTAHHTPPTHHTPCLLYTSPSPRDRQKSRMPSSA